MNIGLIVEGEDDYESYPCLIRKCRPDIDRIYTRNCRGLRKLKTTFVGFLKEFEHNSAIQVQKAIVVRDSDLHDPLRSERELEELLRASGFRPSFGVHFHATKRMLESLLLADEHAIGKVAQRRGKEAQRCVPVSGVLEQLSDAKRILWGRLSEAKLPADKKVFAEIAEASDLAKIIERCSHFRDFVKKANEC